mgnify:CR=1 FL=1
MIAHKIDQAWPGAPKSVKEGNFSLLGEQQTENLPTLSGGESMSFLWFCKGLVKINAQDTKSYPWSNKNHQHYSSPLLLITIAAPRQVKNTLKPSPTRAAAQSSLRSDWIKTPPRNTREIFKECLPISFIWPFLDQGNGLLHWFWISTSSLWFRTAGVKEERWGTGRESGKRKSRRESQI